MNYKDILQNVLNNGVPKQPTRMVDSKAVPVENGTIGTFCEIFRHDMSKGFPLSSLRKLPFKSTCVELEGFIKGITDKRWYQERKCKYWDYWANPKAVNRRMIDWQNKHANDHESFKKVVEESSSLIKDFQKEETDLGPLGYAWGWRKFGEQYGDVTSRDFIEGGCCPATGEYQQIYENINGLGYFSEEGGYDQLKYIVDTLKSNPYDRRMVCIAWNPNQLHLTALPACHFSFVVSVYGNKLNLAWDQRSCDLILNQSIVTYGLLLLLLCEESGLEPGELCGRFIDCHIYENLLDAANEMVKREERELPTVKIKRKDDNSFSIFDWTYNDVELIGYDPHPKLEMGLVTV